MIHRLPRHLHVFALLIVAAPLFAAPVERYVGRDTINPRDLLATAKPEAASMLRELLWTPVNFDVTVTAPVPPPASPDASSQQTDADALVTFASPRPEGDTTAAMNTVVLEWYKARDAKGGLLEKAPALLTLHILDNRLILERGIARAMAARGVHCFIMHDPGWGRRREGASPLSSGAQFFERAVQAVADARRSRDAIAALPAVEAGRVSLQGASLGGFIGSCAAGVDNAFDRVFIVIAGGNLHQMLLTGQNEAARVRRALEASGYTGEKLRELCEKIEPTRLAARLNPARTFLFSALTDQVVPAPSALALARAAGLPDAHHIWLTGDHYTCILHVPWLVNYMAGKISGG